MLSRTTWSNCGSPEDVNPAHPEKEGHQTAILIWPIQHLWHLAPWDSHRTAVILQEAGKIVRDLRQLQQALRKAAAHALEPEPVSMIPLTMVPFSARSRR